MKIIRNPEDGGEIKNVWLNDVKYFGKDEGQTFKPGDVVKVEDELAVFLMGIYDFLEVITKEEAVEYLEKRKNMKFKCDKCDFATNVEIALLGHKRHHEKEEKLDDALGIPVIRGTGRTMEEIDTQKAIDEETKKEGLDVGEGLVELNLKPKVRFT
jgi:hypothetical protein